MKSVPSFMEHKVESSSAFLSNERGAGKQDKNV
jgi:hypothetical protein